MGSSSIFGLLGITECCQIIEDEALLSKKVSKTLVDKLIREVAKGTTSFVESRTDANRLSAIPVLR